jgi:6-phosphofructokinase 1
MQRIAVMTTGGDAPGMNAAIRAVARTGISCGLEVLGVEKGYYGLLDNLFVELCSSSVGGIINKGGTILQTRRSKEFHLPENRHVAYGFLKQRKIDGLIVIGGDGSRKGAYQITKESGIPAVFIPGSIDNDVYGTDQTIGFDTAVNSGLEAIDRIRDTAASHERVFVVEVMGREHGFLALEIGFTGGAEIILAPEFKKDIKLSNICRAVDAGIRRGKNSMIIVMAEGVGLSSEMAQSIEHKTGMETRYTVLGYIQRGGRPSARSRRLGLMFGYEAVMRLQQMTRGQCGMVGIQGSEITFLHPRDTGRKEKKIDVHARALNAVFSI